MLKRPYPGRACFTAFQFGFNPEPLPLPQPPSGSLNHCVAQASAICPDRLSGWPAITFSTFPSPPLNLTLSAGPQDVPTSSPIPSNQFRNSGTRAPSYATGVVLHAVDGGGTGTEARRGLKHEGISPGCPARCTRRRCLCYVRPSNPTCRSIQAV